MSRKGLVLFVAMCIIWGIPYLLIRVAVRQLDPTTLVFARCGLAALVLVPVAALRGELLPVLRRWPWVVAFGAVEMGVPWLLMSRAEQHLTSSMTALLVAAVPICGVVLYRGTHHEERLTAARLAGLLLGISNTLATIPGIVAPIIVGDLVAAPHDDAAHWQIAFAIAAGVAVAGFLVFAAFGRAEPIPELAFGPADADGEAAGKAGDAEGARAALLAPDGDAAIN